MNSVPNKIPSTEARAVAPSPSPMPGPMKPMAMVKNWKLPRNQKGPWAETLPWRSPSGT